MQNQDSVLFESGFDRVASSARTRGLIAVCWGRPGLTASRLLLERYTQDTRHTLCPGLTASRLLLELGCTAHDERLCPGLTASRLLLELNAGSHADWLCPGLTASRLLLEQHQTGVLI